MTWIEKFHTITVVLGGLNIQKSVSKRYKSMKTVGTLDLAALNSHFCLLVVIDVLYRFALLNSSNPCRGAISYHKVLLLLL